MELEHAIQIAIDFEKKVVKTYQDAAAASQDPVGKRILQVMTQEEGTHVAYLEARLREWKQTGQVSLQKLDTLIPKPEALYAALDRMKKTLEKKEIICKAPAYKCVVVYCCPSCGACRECGAQPAPAKPAALSPTPAPGKTTKNSPPPLASAK